MMTRKAAESGGVKAAVVVDGYQPELRPSAGFYHVYLCPSSDCLNAIKVRTGFEGAIYSPAQRAIITADKKPHSDVHCRNLISGAPCNTKMDWLRTLTYPEFTEIAHKP